MVPRFFTKAGASAGEDHLQCDLCPHRCRIAPGGAGRCRVRTNLSGEPALPFYGLISALGFDPIEKKPLYHFRPGSEILSAGFTGCNLRCPFCQNWHISQNTGVSGSCLSPGELIAAVKAAGKTSRAAGPSAGQIAYTYSEPLVHIEFLLDCMKEARAAGIANVLVSNGCVNSEGAAEILKLCDAANIDLKCFSEETYTKLLGGNFPAVLDFIRRAAEEKVHLELTTLIVPGLNDSRAELDKCRDFIAELETGGNAVPWHLSAYHPAWKWKAPATERDFLVSAVKEARKKLQFVYSGNGFFPDGFNDTFCPGCGKVLVKRRDYGADPSGLTLKTANGIPAYFCAFCGKPAPLRG